MISYKDMTFCTYYRDCTKGNDCFRSLKPQVLHDAKKWWGGDNPPFSIFSQRPECFEDKRTMNENHSNT